MERKITEYSVCPIIRLCDLPLLRAACGESAVKRLLDTVSELVTQRCVPADGSGEGHETVKVNLHHPVE